MNQFQFISLIYRSPDFSADRIVRRYIKIDRSDRLVLSETSADNLTIRSSYISSDGVDPRDLQAAQDLKGQCYNEIQVSGPELIITGYSTPRVRIVLRFEPAV